MPGGERCGSRGRSSHEEEEVALDVNSVASSGRLFLFLIGPRLGVD